MRQHNDLIDDPIDPAEQQGADLRQQLDEDALRYVLSSRRGRRFIWNMMGRAGLARNAFAADPHVTAFNTGRQSIATDLLVDMEAINPDAFYLMAKESKEDNQYDRHNHDDGSRSGGNDNDSISAISGTTGG